MRASRGMGAIKKSKIPSATENTMPKGVVKKRRDNTDFTQYKEGGPVGLYANMNARKKKGISRSKSESTVSPKAYANMKAGFPKGKK
jgi:predicted transcriptional regulator